MALADWPFLPRPPGLRALQGIPGMIPPPNCGCAHGALAAGRLRPWEVSLLARTMLPATQTLTQAAPTNAGAIKMAASQSWVLTPGAVLTSRLPRGS